MGNKFNGTTKAMKKYAEIRLILTYKKWLSWDISKNIIFNGFPISLKKLSPFKLKRAFGCHWFNQQDRISKLMLFLNSIVKRFGPHLNFRKIDYDLYLDLPISETCHSALTPEWKRKFSKYLDLSACRPFDLNFNEQVFPDPRNHEFEIQKKNIFLAF